MKLTAEICRDVMPDDGDDRLDIADDEVPGLRFRVTKAGARSFAFRYWNADRTKQHRETWEYPAVKLAEARRLALKLKGKRAQGEDLSAIKAAAKEKAERD